MDNKEEIKGLPEGAKATIIHNRILLEILVFGKNDDKKKIKKMTDKLQGQMFTKKNIKRVRVLWCVNDEKTIEEQKAWLLENADCKYFVFCPENYVVKDKFVDDTLMKIKQFEIKLDSLKSAGIKVCKNKPKELAPVISIAPETSTEVTPAG